MSENDCVFCKIASGEEKSEIVHEEDGVRVFHSIDGEAPGHVVVVSRVPVFSLAEIGKLPEGMANRIFEVAQEVAEKMGVAGSGYTFGINNRSDAGQEVFHVGAHVLGGREVDMP